MNQGKKNPRYLREIRLPDRLVAESDLRAAVEDVEVLVPVLPSHALREVVRLAAPWLPESVPVGCATKGIEEGTGFTMAELLSQELPAGDARVSVLYGPSFALELAQGLPTAVVCAGPASAAEPVIQAFHGGALRVYASADVTGVCVGGSLKNVMAIACGVSDGVGLGANARAALITRGLAEMTRLAVALGADPLTMAGLAGLGDLVLTCTGNLSRNRRVGLALGQGRTLNDILAELGEVAEGVTTARSAMELANRVGVELPITEQVYAMLFEAKPAIQALTDLMGRARKSELQGVVPGR
jgi:glycerol-3-phosphate dehydrogenase (NAD(P)+)